MKSKTFVFYVREASIFAESINDPWEIYYRMVDLAKADQESFWSIGFNSQNQEIYNECLFIGGTSGCSVDNKILFKNAQTSFIDMASVYCFPLLSIIFPLFKC